jgi:type IV secretion system protein VirB4
MTGYAELIANEKAATNYIPYSKQLAPSICATVERDLTSTVRIKGIPHETMSVAELNGFTRIWNATINTLGANNTRVALWTHIVRRKLAYDISGIEYDNHFSQMLGAQYAKKIEKDTFYLNELYLSPVYRPAPGRAERIGAKLDKEGGDAVASQGAEQIERITAQILRSLRRYHPSVLGVEEFKDRPALSHLQSFYGYILNGDWSPVALDGYTVRHSIQRNDFHFGHEIVEIQGPVKSRYAGVIGLKAPYGAEMAKADMFHGLLSLPCEFILSQSLTFLPLNKADKFLHTQISQFSSTDANVIQLKELKEARNNLQAGKFGMGEHEFILTIYGDSIKEVNEGISWAVSALEAKNLTAIRKRRGKMISQYFGMLPGNFSTGRLDAMPVSTDNFASFFPMHNFLTGNAEGSQWGSPITVMKTTSGAPYFFNYHISKKSLKNQGVQLEYAEDPDEPEVSEEEEERAELEGRAAKEHKKQLGNYVVIGPSGSGKTLTKLQLRALMRKVRRGHDAKPYKTFAWDKDYGEEILTRAMGGRHFRFEDGRPSGLNPFGLPNIPINRQFIMQLFMWCAETDKTYRRSSSDEEMLNKVIGDVYDLPNNQRMARMMDTLPGSTEGVRTASGVVTGLKAALKRWVGKDSPYGWVLDNPVDLFDLTTANDFCFEMSGFLDNDMARTPIQMLINHKIESVIDGSPFVLDIAEAWKALKDPFYQSYIENKAKTVRKQGGIIGLDTQDPTDLSKSAIRGTLLQQFPTQLILPNDKADRADYMDGLKLTEREFKLVQEGMLETPGTFLLKQGNESVVVQNDMSGMEDMMAVLSASTDNVMLVRDLIERNGDDPKIWLPLFFRART